MAVGRVNVDNSLGQIVTETFMADGTSPGSNIIAYAEYKDNIYILATTPYSTSLQCHLYHFKKGDIFLKNKLSLGNNAFTSSNSLVTDSEGNVYIAGNKVIRKYSQNLDLISTYQDADNSSGNLRIKGNYLHQCFYGTQRGTMLHKISTSSMESIASVYIKGSGTNPTMLSISNKGNNIISVKKHDADGLYFVDADTFDLITLDGRLDSVGNFVITDDYIYAMNNTGLNDTRRIKVTKHSLIDYSLIETFVSEVIDGFTQGKYLTVVKDELILYGSNNIEHKFKLFRYKPSTNTLELIEEKKRKEFIKYEVYYMNSRGYHNFFNFTQPLDFAINGVISNLGDLDIVSIIKL